MVAGPELSRMIQEFEGSNNQTEENDHHEQKSGIQKALRRTEYTIFIQELGNPFPRGRRKPDGDSYLGYYGWYGGKNCSQCYKNWWETVQLVCQWAVCHKLSRRIIFPLSRRRKGRPWKTKVEVLRDDCVLFLRLYIACQIRDGNTEDFFKYENQPWPPPLSQLCQLRGGQKADLALCLPSTSAEIATQPVADVVILDGTAIVQMLQPRTARTFDEYLSTVYAPYILKHLETARRADLIWDVYQDDLMKRSLREKRGSGQRRNILASTRIPAD